MTCDPTCATIFFFLGMVAGTIAVMVIGLALQTKGPK
jgi:hypothetical protein